MAIEIKVPTSGESITEVQIAQWLKKDGDYVEKDEEIAEIDTDKATLSLVAEEAGILKILIKEGETVTVGAVIATIEPGAAPAKKTETIPTKKAEAEPEKIEPAKPIIAENIPAKESAVKDFTSASAIKKPDEKKEADKKIETVNKIDQPNVVDGTKQSPENKVVSMDTLSAPVANKSERIVRREKMSVLRKKVAQRLVAVKQTTAMLTTFNEIDMTAVMNIRKQYKDIFKEKHGVGLGFMSFFTKAVTEALKNFPTVNAMIDGDEIEYHDYMDIGIAVSAPKGLMVPVIRNAENLSLAQIESSIISLAGKARDGKLSIDEMTGGTFTITNGGVFGSMLSTPIINPPQSAILGMHNIVDRPMAINGKVEIRPIMYVALSYDHRIIDGKESVGFLVKVKQLLEDPIKLLTGGNDPMKILLRV